jgi:hypothetical protein
MPDLQKLSATFRRRDAEGQCKLINDNSYEPGLLGALDDALLALFATDALVVLRFLNAQRATDLTGLDAGLRARWSAALMEAREALGTGWPEHRMLIALVLSGLGQPGLDALRTLVCQERYREPVAHALRLDAPALIAQGLAGEAVAIIEAGLAVATDEERWRLIEAASGLGQAARGLIAPLWPLWGQEGAPRSLARARRALLARLIAGAGDPDAALAAALIAEWDVARAEEPPLPEHIEALALALGAVGRGVAGAWERVESAARDWRLRACGEALWGLWEEDAARLAIAAGWSQQAAERLRAVADDAALIAWMAHEDRLIVAGALRAAALGEPQAALLAAITEVAHQPHDATRREALRAVKALARRPDGEPALRALLALLEDEDEAVRRGALYVLREAPTLPAASLLALCAREEVADAARRALCSFEPSALSPADWSPAQRAALDHAARAQTAPCPLALAYGGRLPMEWVELWSAGLALPAGLEFASQRAGAPPRDGAMIFAQDASGDYALWPAGEEPAVWWFGVAGEAEQIADDLRGFLCILSAGVGCAREAAADVRAYRASGDGAGFEAWLKANRRAYKIDKANTRALARWVTKRSKPAPLAALEEAVSG